jgi:type II secretory pathway pseudopilin PulG
MENINSPCDKREDESLILNKERNKKMMNTNESGRSMVEMLGVLAIIGVLSIGGIAGYTQAMRKYRVNEAVNAITMGAVMCTTEQTAGVAALEREGVITGFSCSENTVNFSLDSNVIADDVIAALSGQGTFSGEVAFTLNAS